jgi:hypothetical protein
MQCTPKENSYYYFFSFYTDWHRSANSHVVALKSDQENAKNKGMPGWPYTFPTWLISDLDKAAVEPVP